MNERELKENLENNTAIICKCREEKNISSCMKCDKFIDCTKRNDFVASAYSYMNKGQSMDFDF